MSNDYENMTNENLIEILNQQAKTISNLKTTINSFESKFNEAQLLANMGFWEWDIPNDIVTWSDQVYKIFDIELGSKITYDVVVNRIHPGDREHHHELTEAWINNKGGEPYGYRIIISNGDTRHVQAYGKVVCDNNGKPIGFLGAAQDVTKQHVLQHKLEEALTKTIEGYLPICSYCKAIRNKNNEWDSIENYIGQHSMAKFSHGICPDCVVKVRKEMGLD